MIRPVLELGDPRLRMRCAPVERLDDPALRAEAADLADTLAAFRAAHGFGRAIAAPQIGVLRRIVALDLGAGPRVLVNPEITWRSDETMTLYDDCMSFPWLLVRVRRHRSISLRYLDPAGGTHDWPRLPPAEAELLQHELDHLGGILALDRAEGENAVVGRAYWERERPRLAVTVDWPPG